MSRVARYVIRIDEDLFDDETAREAANATLQNLIDGYYRSVQLLSVEEVGLGEEDDDE